MFLLLACTASDGSETDASGTDSGPVADYTLELAPLIPTNVNPFNGVDRIDLVFDSGSGSPIRVSLDAPGSNESATADGLPALDETVIELEGYAAGELVAYGRSRPVTALESDDNGDPISLFVGRPGTLGWLGSLPEETVFSVGAALGDGRFVVMGGVGGDGRLGNAREEIFTLDLTKPNSDLSWEISDEEMPRYWLPDEDSDEDEGRRERAGATLSSITTGDDTGKFLLAGGCEGEPFEGARTATADVQIYDPEEDQFDAIGKTDVLTSARCGHAAIARSDGTILVWGGWGWTGSSNSIFAVVEGDLYDPAEREFNKVDVEQSRNSGTYGVALADLGEDGTMVSGGVLIGDFIADAGEYADWKTTNTSFRVSLRGEVGSESYAGLGAVAAHAMVAIGDGDVLSFGGVISNAAGEELDALASATDRVWRFYKGSQTWTEVGSMAMPRAGHAVAQLDASHILIVGGSPDWGPTDSHGSRAISCAEVYDIVNNTSQMLDGCTEESDAGGLPNRAESPLVLIDPSLGVLVSGGFDGDQGARRGTTLYSFDR